MAFRIKLAGKDDVILIALGLVVVRTRDNTCPEKNILLEAPCIWKS